MPSMRMRAFRALAFPAFCGIANLLRCVGCCNVPFKENVERTANPYPDVQSFHDIMQYKTRRHVEAIKLATCETVTYHLQEL